MGRTFSRQDLDDVHELIPSLILLPFDRLVFPQRERLIEWSLRFSFTLEDRKLVVDGVQPGDCHFLLRIRQARKSKRPETPIRAMSDESYQTIQNQNHQTHPSSRSLTFWPHLLGRPPDLVPKHREIRLVKVPHEHPHRYVHLSIAQNLPHQPLRLLDARAIRERPILAHEPLYDRARVVPQNVGHDVAGSVHRMCDRIEIPLLGEITDGDARHALGAKIACEVAGALPGHRVGRGGEPGAVETSSVCPVFKFDPDFVGLDEVEERGSRNA